MLNAARAQELRTLLDQFLATHDDRARIGFDPVEFPHQYADPRDVEVSALISACLAYGRADLFRPILRRLFEGMGPSPADFAAGFDPRRHSRIFQGVVYRFNLGSDLAQLVWAIGCALRELGSLGLAFSPPESASDGRLATSLQAFVDRLRAYPTAPVVEALGPLRGFDHLLPLPLRGGSCKRLLLFLRWMVRGPDRVDFGLWPHVSPAGLVVPLDTHIGRISRNLGFTRRTDLSWRTAEEITAGLRQLDPHDPVKYDFALCHLGISGACPVTLSADRCARCQLRSSCHTGQRTLRRAGRSSQAVPGLL